MRIHKRDWGDVLKHYKAAVMYIAIVVTVVLALQIKEAGWPQ